jgi:hypothetical protein
MRKLILIGLAGFIASGAVAQTRELNVKNRIKATPVSKAKYVSHNVNALAKTTATAFITESFGSGSNGNLPTGWDAVSVQGNGTWKWISQASAGQFSIGALNSTTAADGWMIYDSDSIGAVNNATTLQGYLQSPIFDCSGHGSVQLSFEQDFRKFNDSCFVLVSNDNGSTFTKFSVVENNALGGNSSLDVNPTLTRINISSAAANQSQVIIRFLYKYAGPAGGGYNWLIDDFSLSELDPVELDLSGGLIYDIVNDSTFGSFGALPVQFADSVFPLGFLTNYGALAQTSIDVNAKIFKDAGTTPVYNQTVTISDIDVNGVDTAVDFGLKKGYFPGVGNYLVGYSVNQPGDAIGANNFDTTRFSITDSTYSMDNNARPSGSFFLHRGLTATAAEASFVIGTIFEIPQGRSDTLTSLSAAFAPGTAANTVVEMQVFKFDGSAWSLFAGANQRTLTAGNIPAAGGTLIYTSFGMDPNNGLVELTEGTYAVVAQTINAPQGADVLILATGGAGRRITGTQGVSDTSTNTGGPNFGAAGLPGGITNSTPRVRMHFRNGAATTSIGNEAVVEFAGNPYPNPAKSKVAIPFTVNRNADVTVSITSITGQVLMQQSIANAAYGTTRSAIFNTENLANGTYLYTVSAEGKSISGKLSVAH